MKSMTQFIINEYTYCIEYFQAKPGCREKLLASLLNLLKPTRAEKGCLQYDLIQDDKNPELIIMLVKFENKLQMQNHENQDYIKAFAENDLPQYCENFTWNDGRGIE